MATNTTDVELVRFQASGLETITELTQRFSQEARAAQQRADLFAASMQNGFAKAAAEINAATLKTERMQAALRNQQYKGLFDSGQLGRHMAAMTQYGRQQDILERQARNQARARDIQSGAYLKHAYAVSRAERESAKLADREKQLNDVARYGKAGAAARHLGGVASGALAVAGGVAAAGVATGVGLATAGFSNTVEFRQFELAMQRLSRSVASIAIPALEKLTEAADQGAAQIQGMTDGQKDAALYTGGGILAATFFGPKIWRGGRMGISGAASVQAGVSTYMSGGVNTAAPTGAGTILGRIAGALGLAQGAYEAGKGTYEMGLRTQQNDWNPIKGAGANLLDTVLHGGSRMNLFRAVPQMATEAGDWVVGKIYGEEKQKELKNKLYNDLGFTSPDGQAPPGSILNDVGRFGIEALTKEKQKAESSRSVTPLPGSPTELGGQHFAIQQSVLEATTPLGAAGSQSVMGGLIEAMRELTETIRQSKTDKDGKPDYRVPVQRAPAAGSSGGFYTTR